MPPSTPLTCPYHYILLSLSRSRNTTDTDIDILTIRKSLQDALSDTFGHTTSNTYMDVLAMNAQGNKVIVRVGTADREKVLGAIAASSRNTTVKFSVVKASSFLPSLVSSDWAS